ncbi:hypothetical protein VTK26DRAFT_8849 [Humicola hyalothermophila]
MARVVIPFNRRLMSLRSRLPGNSIHRTDYWSCSVLRARCSESNALLGLVLLSIWFSTPHAMMDVWLLAMAQNRPYVLLSPILKY